MLEHAQHFLYVADCIHDILCGAFLTDAEDISNFVLRSSLMGEAPTAMTSG